MAGLGKYCTGRYGGIWVYRVKKLQPLFPLASFYQNISGKSLPVLATWAFKNIDEIPSGQYQQVIPMKSKMLEYLGYSRIFKLRKAGHF